MSEEMNMNRQLYREDYKVDEVAELLGVHTISVYSAIQRGELGHYRIGRHIRITREHLDEFRKGNME